MNEIKFFFSGIKSFSANKSVSFNKKGKYYKTANKKIFQDAISYGMLKHRPGIFDFEANYSIYDHILVGNVYMFIPRHKLITKKDYLNMTAGDVNNNKVFTDCIFSHFDKLDDCHLIVENSFKLASPDKNYHMAYKLSIFSRDDLERWSVNAWEEINLKND